MSEHAQPAWWLLDENRELVAAIRAPSAQAAREHFKREGLTGARVVRAEVAPVDEDAKPAGPCCENSNCRNPINPDADYRFVTGWERISRNGAGGTHAIRGPDRSTERFLCRFCVDKLADGVSLQQQTLAVP
jgi:hypothetical protein